MMFKDLIRKTMEVYVDDMLVKSRVVGDHMTHLGEMLVVLRKYKMKLNSLKCAFVVSSRKFFGVHGEPKRYRGQSGEDQGLA